MDAASSKEWENIQEVLQLSLKQEIVAMREMLSNMHQEELSLLAKDRKAWTLVMMQRANLLARLSEVRTERLAATQRLESIKKRLSPSFKDENCEIISMRDQLTALVEKMNQQNLRIQSLEDHDGRVSSIYPPIDQKTQTTVTGRARAILATYPRPK
jgi:hypothetical protein